MSMVVAGMLVRMRMGAVFMPVDVAMNKVMGFKEGNILQDFFRQSIPDFPFIFTHNHYPIRYLRHNVYILGRGNNRATLLAKLVYRIY